MLFLDLPNDIILYILSKSRFNKEPHIIYIKKNENDYLQIFYKGEWSNNRFEGYGHMYSKKINKCSLICEEPYNINVLNTFYKYFSN